MDNGLNIKFALKNCLRAKKWHVTDLHRAIIAKGKSISYQQLINILNNSPTVTFKTVDAITSGLEIPMVAFIWFAQNIEDRGVGCSTEDYNQLQNIFERIVSDDSIVASAKINY